MFIVLITESKKYSSARERQLPYTQQVIRVSTSGTIHAASVSIQSIIMNFNGSALFLYSFVSGLAFLTYSAKACTFFCFPNLQGEAVTMNTNKIYLNAADVSAYMGISISFHPPATSI